MVLVEILIIVAAGAAIAAAVGGLVYVAGLAIAEERRDRRHMQASAHARQARTTARIPEPDLPRRRPALAGSARR